jgi:predicted transcriptional regulator
MNVNETFSRKLNSVMKEINVTAKQLSTLSGVSLSTIKRLKSNPPKYIRMRTALKISYSLGFSLEEFLAECRTHPRHCEPTK